MRAKMAGAIVGRVRVLRHSLRRGRVVLALPLVLMAATAAIVPTATPAGAGPGDPGTFEARILASSDDAEERASGSMLIGSSDLELTFDRTTQTVGLRFGTVGVPNGATITAAWLQFTVDEGASDATDLMIRAEAADSSQAFGSSAFDISSRPVTTAAVAWAPQPWPTIGDSGPDQRSPDLSAVVQEVIDRPGWSQNSPVSFVITGTGERVAESYDGRADSAPLLHVEYTESLNAVPVVTVTAPVDGAEFSDEDTVTLEANASDAEDGDLSGAIVWSSDIDGVIGAGPLVVSTDLGLGTHVLSSLVSDSAGQSAAATVSITISQANPPSVFQTRVSQASDDAEERSTGSMLIGSSDLELTFDQSQQTVGMRFSTVDVPKGATITAAWLQFTVDERSSDPTDLLIRAEAADSSPTFATNRFNITSRPVTAAAVPWVPPPWPTIGDSGPDQHSPDLSAVVQEVIDRPGWSQNDPLSFMITGTGQRVAKSFDGRADAAPLLHIEYAGSLNSVPSVTISGPSDGAQYTDEDAVTLEANASDAEDGDLSAAIVWSSDIDGPIGTGTPVIVTDLRLGTHVLTALVSDSANQAAAASVTVTISQANPPLVFQTRVSQASDDAEERASGTVSTASSDLELTYDAGGHQIVGTRFASVGIPAGATVTKAWIQFVVDEVSTDPTALIIRAEAADEAETYTGLNGSIRSRPTTTSSVSWTPAPWTTVGLADLDQRTPDIAAIVQEVTDRPGWASDGPVNIIFEGIGKRVAEAFDGGASKAALLHVEYSAPSNVRPTLTIATPSDNAAFAFGSVVSFSASSSDAEDGDLSSAIVWSSSRDGQIGTGPSFATSNLSIGVHVIDAVVSDSGGQSAIDTRLISVEPTDPFIIGAGDIALCNSDRDEATADIIKSFPNATVFTLGDNAYSSGSAANFNNCYNPSWGQFKDRTFPSAGNHEYNSTAATPYFDYFGAAAGTPGQGWYSYDVGTWHIVVLNSNCAAVGGCGPGSAQANWLAADLAANPAQCTAAYWHHPRFSSWAGNNSDTGTFWELLYEAGADVVLTGHSHHYERFARQDPSGQLDSMHGIRQFVVGTGGAGVFPADTIIANSEVQFDAYGVIGLTLSAGSYTWEFMPVAGESAVDSGQESCIDPSPARVTETPVVAATDDAEERGSGEMSTSSSDLELTYDARSNQLVGTRFASLDVPAGATITKAWIQFRVDESTSEPTALTIRGEPSVAAPGYSSQPHNISSRSSTLASVVWNPPPWLSVREQGVDQRTPNLASVVQEIIDLPGWSRGNPINFVISGTGKRVADSYDGGATNAPILHVEYL